MEQGEEKPDWFWYIASGAMVVAMGVGSLFGWLAARKQEEKPARRERKPDPAAPKEKEPAEPE